MSERFEIDKPVYNQGSFYGRFRHFASITDPRIAFASNSELIGAKRLYDAYKRNDAPPDTRMSELLRSQKLVWSAFHPDTGELQNFAGRMCFNVWGGTVLCGAMMIWYKSTPSVLFWQWANQSFNALVNYTNRNANSELKTSDLVTAYGSAVGGALTMAMTLKSYFAKRQVSQTLQRMVPLGAVAVANAINIPMMRQNELKKGVVVTDDKGNPMGESRLAAAKAISQVVLSRNVIVAPSMILTPILVERAMRKEWFRANLRTVNIPFQLLLTFVMQAFVAGSVVHENNIDHKKVLGGYGSMIPVGCALFPQQSSLDVETIKKWEPEAYEKLKDKSIGKVFFNKGL